MFHKNEYFRIHIYCIHIILMQSFYSFCIRYFLVEYSRISIAFIKLSIQFKDSFQIFGVNIFFLDKFRSETCTIM